MDTPTETSVNGTAILTGVAAALGAAAVAAVAWALIGYYIAATLSLGLILLPLGSGCGAGAVMRIGGGGFQRHVRWVAAIITLAGCVIGDFAWVAWVTHKPLSLLLGSELVPTMNTLFNIQKAVLYAVACYLAYSIAAPPRGFVPD